MNRAAVTKAILDQARRQGWVITRAQGLAAGAHTDHMTALVRAGILVRPYPGVYVVGGAPEDYTVAIRAALAAVGPEATATHWTAAWVQGLVQKRPALIHATVVSRHTRKLDGVEVHLSSQPVASRLFKGVPCTLPGRTLVDIAATATPSELADAIDRARAGRIVRLKDIEAETRIKRRGSGALRRELERLGHIAGPTPSVLESRMARLFRTYRLPEPTAERVAGPEGRYRIDYTYRDQHLAIELYGYASHSSPQQLGKDAARQNDLTLEGWTVLIFTWQDITDQPARVAAQIRAALAQLSRRG